MNSTIRLIVTILSIYLIVPLVVNAKGLTPADSIKLSEEWWDKGFEQYEKGNYEAAYELFEKSNRYFGGKWSEKNPYDAMNHCLYKMGKMELVDTIHAFNYYEELDTVKIFSPDLIKSQDFIFRQDIASAFLFFHRALRADTLINRQNRRVHARRLAIIASAFANMGYFQDAIDCYHKEYAIEEKRLPQKLSFKLDVINQRLIECFLNLGQGDSALCVALNYANKYKNGNEIQFLFEYENAETYLIQTYLRTGRYNEAFREIEYADSVYKALEGENYRPFFRLSRESEYYDAIGRPDKAYKIIQRADSIQLADTAIYKYRDVRPLVSASSKIGNHKLGIAILDSIVNSYRLTERDSNTYFSYNEINDTKMLAKAYSSDGQFKKALEKYLILDSIFCSILRVNDTNRGYDFNHVETLFMIVRNAYNSRLDSLGDTYLERLKDEIKFYRLLNGWENNILMLEAQKAICHGKPLEALEYGERCFQAFNGDVQEWVKDFLSYWYIRTNQVDKAYEIESELVKGKKKAILNVFEELSDSERANLWRFNGDSFRNLLWSILFKQDSTLWGQVYDDVALFSKGLLLTVSSNPDYKKVLEINWKDISFNLKKKEMAIEFITIPTVTLHPDSTIYAALYLKKGMACPRIKYLCLGDDLHDLVNRINISRDFQDIYDYVWADLEDEMEGISTVYFSADGYLHKIPIEYFISNQKNKKINAYRLTSTREIALKRKNKGFDNAALYGGLEYVNHYCDSLRYSQNEINVIASFMRKNKVVTNEYCHQEGTASTLLAYNQKPLSLLHLATHGFYHSQKEESHNPLLMQDNQSAQKDIAMQSSGLAFSDRKMSADEIAKIQLNGLQLVTLSACRSALGDIADGEGVFGLQRAFKQAGAQSILMTLWDVIDKPASEFMCYFYQRVSMGDSFQKALRKAQEHMKKFDVSGVNVYEEPINWAGFVLLDAIDY